MRAWNLFVLLSLALAGAFACAWLRELRFPRAAALVGGIAFAAAPYRVVQSRGHLLGATALLLPLALFAFERALRTRRQGWWWLSRVALASIPLSGQVHLALGAIPFAVLYAVCRTRAWRPLVETAVGAVAAVLAGVLIRRTVISGSIDSGGRSLREVGVYSADWSDFASRGVRHGAESFVFLGWATPIIALLALALLAWTRRYGLALALGLGALVPMLLALGTTTPVYGWLWHALPPLRYPRVPERMMPIANLAVAALVAFALAVALRFVRGRLVWLVAGIAAAAVLADTHVRVFHPTAAGTGNRAYAAVRSLPAGRMLELPVFLPDIHYGSVYAGYTTQTRRQRPAGYSTTAPVAADVLVRRLRPLSCGDWTTDAPSLLPGLRVAAITLHRGLYVENPLVDDTAWFAWRGLVDNGWKPLATDGAVTAFAQGASTAAPPFREPRRSTLHFCIGWYRPDDAGRQMADSHASVWASGPGTVRLFVRSPAPLDVKISVDGHLRRLLHVQALVELRVTIGDSWHLLSFDAGRLPIVGTRPRGMRIVAYAVP